VNGTQEPARKKHFTAPRLTCYGRLETITMLSGEAGGGLKTSGKLTFEGLGISREEDLGFID